MSTGQHYKNATPPTHIKLLIVTEAPPSKPENYFYNISGNDYSHGPSRSFFRGIMQGIGLLNIGVSIYSEKALLSAFLNKGYFLIDACPEPLVDMNEKQLSSSMKKKIMSRHILGLRETILSLNPEKVAFVCSTNEEILERFKNDSCVKERLLIGKVLPYPGNGWLRRPDKQGFIDLFPAAYRLASIY